MGLCRQDEFCSRNSKDIIRNKNIRSPLWKRFGTFPTSNSRIKMGIRIKPGLWFKNQSSSSSSSIDCRWNGSILNLYFHGRRLHTLLLRNERLPKQIFIVVQQHKSKSPRKIAFIE